MQAWNKLSDNLTNDSMGTVHEKATE
jgi:hypothetical protein